MYYSFETFNNNRRSEFSQKKIYQLFYSKENFTVLLVPEGRFFFFLLTKILDGKIVSFLSKII